MEIESKVIAAIYKDRQSFERVRESFNEEQEDVFSDINGILFDRAVEYYERDDDAQDIDTDVIRSYIEREYPRHEAVISVALDRIDEAEVSCRNIVNEFTELRLHSLGQQIAQAIIANQDPMDLIAHYQNLKNGADEERPDLLPEAATFEDIEEALNPENVIELYPQELQERVKYALRGHHVVVYARPETGKSLVMINMTRGFLAQGLRVLYLGNEDPKAAMLPRFFSSMLNMTREDLSNVPTEEGEKLIQEAGNDGFRFVHMEPGNFPQIRGLVRAFQPDVLIVDQIRNVLTGGDGLTVGLERAGVEMRTIAGEFDLLAVSVTQAGESASNKLVLGLSDIDSSKTGLPATCDLMIGVGVDENYESRGKRMISLSKNKIGADHSFFSVDVDPSRSRVL